MRKVSAALFILLFVTAASATTISDEKVSVDLESSEVSIVLEVEELTSSRLSYFTQHEIQDLRVESNGEELDCRVYSSDTNNQISCETDVKENFTARITYFSPGLVELNGGSRSFEIQKSFIRPTLNYSLEVVLPKGNILATSNSSESVVEPSYAQISSDGQRISVSWNEKPELGSSKEYRVRFQGTSNGNRLLEQIGALVVALGVLALAYLVLRKLREEDLESVYTDLEEDEKQVIDLLKDKEGSMLQKDLVEELEYSKAKISGTVSKLVEKEIIEKEKEGRSNRVSIKKNYRY